MHDGDVVQSRVCRDCIQMLIEIIKGSEVNAAFEPNFEESQRSSYFNVFNFCYKHASNVIVYTVKHIHER
jgi:hypothetical protein